MQTNISRLENGLTVASTHMPDAHSVAVGVWIKAGARDESEGLNGVAHFLEHMAFKGTRNRDAAHIAREVEDVGGFMNAHTCLLYTSPSPRDMSASRMPSSA